jgi:acetoacetyl-CoA reductase
MKGSTSVPSSVTMNAPRHQAGDEGHVIAPGYIATEMVQAVPEEVLKTKILPLIPVGRLGEADEIARTVLFLAGDDAGFITGATMTVNGGQYMM